MGAPEDRAGDHAFLGRAESPTFSALDLLPRRTTVERLIELFLSGPPQVGGAAATLLHELRERVGACSLDDVNLLVFGGGTGLSTIIGGDSNHIDWPKAPFSGLKEIFPRSRAVVCVTDDGGSTGELLKDLPLIGLGDLRHVLLAAINGQNLEKIYSLKGEELKLLAARLHSIFNYRFRASLHSEEELLALPGIDLDGLPAYMAREFRGLIHLLFSNPILRPTLSRPQCLGNLLLAAAIVQDRRAPHTPTPQDVRDGVNFVAQLIGVEQDHVLPCTVTPCQLKMLYSNGVLITGEDKSSKARRGCPVDHAFVEFAGSPEVLPEIVKEIAEAHIIIFAPGSLYSSIVPVLQVPGVSAAIRANKTALKILAANIWAQAGETDSALDAPDRRYYVSDLIKAYGRNLPSGVEGIFQVVISLAMRDIPGSIIQNYAVEGKTPIYLDRGRIWEMGLLPVEANIFSRQALEANTVKHDSTAFARSIKALWWGRDFLEDNTNPLVSGQGAASAPCWLSGEGLPASRRYQEICALLREKGVPEYEMVASIFWRHKDIPAAHLDLVAGLRLVDVDMWSRSQKWDNVFSFYDPDDRLLKIRRNVLEDHRKFEVAFLIALGQSLLGDYCQNKEIYPLEDDGGYLGRVYRLTLRPDGRRRSYFNREELEEYLELARMNRSQESDAVFLRVLNGEEGFTPPGMLFGLIYAWYLDNQLASHVEYKMSIMRMPVSDLVPEQVRSLKRRKATIKFFREKVFRQRVA